MTCVLVIFPEWLAPASGLMVLHLHLPEWVLWSSLGARARAKAASPAAPIKSAAKSDLCTLDRHLFIAFKLRTWTWIIVLVLQLKINHAVRCFAVSSHRYHGRGRLQQHDPYLHHQLPVNTSLSLL